MSSFDSRNDFCRNVGNEVLHRMDQVSIMLGIVRRDVSRAKIALNDTWPEQRFYVAAEVTRAWCEDWEALTCKYLHPMVDSLARGIDTAIVSQLVKTLRTAKQVIPLHISGTRECVQWMLDYWRDQKTSTADRCFLLSPDCEGRVLRRLPGSDDRFSSCLSPTAARGFDWQGWWMLQSLQDYVVAFQQQAVTVTSVNLKSPSNKQDTFVQTLQYKDLCIQVICTRLPGEKYRIRINWVGGITRFNLNHCGLITEAAFTAIPAV